MTRYIPLYLFGLIIKYFPRTLGSLVSNISDDNSSITCGCRPSQMCINCLSKDTTFIHIFILLINLLQLTTFSIFLLHVCKRDYTGARTITSRSYEQIADVGTCVSRQAWTSSARSVPITTLLLAKLASNSLFLVVY